MEVDGALDPHEKEWGLGCTHSELPEGAQLAQPRGQAQALTLEGSLKPHTGDWTAEARGKEPRHEWKR